MFIDTRSTTAAKSIAEKVADTKRQKTIDTRFQYVQDLVRRKVIELAYVSTENMDADVFTKPLSRESFERHRSKLLNQFSFMLSWFGW